MRWLTRHLRPTNVADTLESTVRQRTRWQSSSEKIGFRSTKGPPAESSPRDDQTTQARAVDRVHRQRTEVRNGLCPPTASVPHVTRGRSQKVSRQKDTQPGGRTSSGHETDRGHRRRTPSIAGGHIEDIQRYFEDKRTAKRTYQGQCT